MQVAWTLDVETVLVEDQVVNTSLVPAVDSAVLASARSQEPVVMEPRTDLLSALPASVVLELVLAPWNRAASWAATSSAALARGFSAGIGAKVPKDEDR